MDFHRRHDPLIFALRFLEKHVWLSLLLIAFVTSTATAQQWQQTASSPKGSGITDLAVKQSNGYLFATTGSFDWPNADTGGVHRSTDGGNTWTRVFPAFVARVIDVTPDGTIWASIWDFPNEDESLYSSTDDGDTWTLRYNGAPNNNVFCFAYDPVNPLRMFIGIRSSLVFSNDGGLTWSHITPVNLGWWIIQVDIQQPFGINVGRIWVIAQNPTGLENHLYWNDAPPGIGWTRILGDAPTDTMVSMTIVYDSTDSFGRYIEGLYVGTSNGRIYKASIGPFSPGSGPMALNYQDPDSSSMVAFGNIDSEDAINNPGFVHHMREHDIAMDRRRRPHGPTNIGGAGGIVRTTDLGQSWEVINDGFPATDLRMSSIAAHITSSSTATVYAGMFLDQNDGGPVYWREVVATDVEQTDPAVPGAFALHQNYPNPFNPSTDIRYQISDYGYVKLGVFDLLGREVATLVNENQVPGTYEVTWDAGGEASGIYFYRLRAGDFVETKRLLLLR
jgi:hypothetical protein